MVLIKKGKFIWLLLLGVVLGSNFILYHTAVGKLILPPETSYIVFGSLFDLIIVLPILAMLYKRKFSLKFAITLAALGCILARFLIPSDLLAPYQSIIWIGIAAEIAIISLEFYIIFTVIRLMPRIRKKVKSSPLPVIFSFPQAIDLYIKKKPIVHILCSEALLFYYAFFSWKKTPPSGISLYKNTSFIAIQMMILHAMVIETIAIHWWLHNLSVVISMILLVLNLYSLILLIANIQAVRLNPIYIDKQQMYLSLGLFKRVNIPFNNINSIIDDSDSLAKKIPKDTIDFITSDLDKTSSPDIIIKMKKPVTATLFMGIQKSYSKIAIKSDCPNELKQLILKGMS